MLKINKMSTAKSASIVKLTASDTLSKSSMTAIWIGVTMQEKRRIAVMKMSQLNFQSFVGSMRHVPIEFVSVYL